MSVFINLGARAAVVAFIFILGAFYGKQLHKQQNLQAQLSAYKKIGDINNAIQSMDNYTLCRKLGGMRQECASLIPKAPPSAKDKSPRKAGAI